MDHELSTRVLGALHAGRKIEAIKLLREEHGIGLKQARLVIDAYLRDNPHLEMTEGSGKAANMLIWLAVVAALVYGTYKFLS